MYFRFFQCLGAKKLVFQQVSLSLSLELSESRSWSAYVAANVAVAVAEFNDSCKISRRFRIATSPRNLFEAAFAFALSEYLYLCLLYLYLCFSLSRAECCSLHSASIRSTAIFAAEAGSAGTTLAVCRRVQRLLFGSGTVIRLLPTARLGAHLFEND